MTLVQFTCVDESDYDKLYFDPLYAKETQTHLFIKDPSTNIMPKDIEVYDLVYIMNYPANPHEILFCVIPENSKDNKPIYFRFEYNTIDKHTFVDITEDRPSKYVNEEAIYPTTDNKEDTKLVFTRHSDRIPCIRVYSKQIHGFLYGWKGPNEFAIS